MRAHLQTIVWKFGRNRAICIVHNVCAQANLWCTSSRARKVVISLTLGAIIFEAINVVILRPRYVRVVMNVITAVLFSLIMPVAVLVINVVVAIQVRRAAIHSAANLGVQPHHQSTSAVPTITLITTSLIYVLLHTMRGSLFLIWWWVINSDFNIKTKAVVHKCFHVGSTVYRLIFTYNFYVYLITGKLFRSDLYKLLCRCSTSSSAPTPIPAHAHALGALAPAVIAAAAADDDGDGDDAEVARRDDRADTAV